MESQGQLLQGIEVTEQARDQQPNASQPQAWSKSHRVALHMHNFSKDLLRQHWRICSGQTIATSDQYAIALTLFDQAVYEKSLLPHV
jgi:hypothetical protein